MDCISKRNIQISGTNQSRLNVCMKKVLSVHKGSKTYYMYDVLFFFCDDISPKCCSKWELKIGQNINWNNCFKYINSITDVNLKWFQLRIIHRIIGTNVILKEMGIEVNNRCGLCNRERENIEHIFWYCNVSQDFWKKLSELINIKCTNVFNLQLTKSLIILGTDSNVKIDSTMYLILLLAKQYIYRCKIERKTPSLNVFKKKLLFRFQIEEHNAKLMHLVPNFTARWHCYKGLWSEVT